MSALTDRAGALRLPAAVLVMGHALLTLAPIAAVMLTAILTAAVLDRRFGTPPETGRLVSLDGLRGYLALGVFIHHAMMWRGYIYPPHRWGGLPHALRAYIHAGESAVTVFFMMTGLLFGMKLLDGRTRPIDWQRLYVSRVLRIYPLFCVAFVAVLLITAVTSRGRLLVPPVTLCRALLAWAHFGRPDINAMPATWMTMAGVTWSLEYEWLFYAALPLAALLFGARPPLRWLAIASVGTLVWAYWIWRDPMMPFHWEHLGAFSTGAATAVLTRVTWIRGALAGPVAACVAIVAAALAPIYFDEPYQWAVLGLLAIAFVVVACGNPVFGLLRLPSSRLLGEISYSIYLLHGFLLFAVIRTTLGIPAAASLSATMYWGMIVALTPVLVGITFVTFRMIERPAIRAAPRVHEGLTDLRRRWTSPLGGLERLPRGVTERSRLG